MKAEIGIVVTYNKGGSGEHNSIEAIGKIRFGLADSLPEGALLYSQESHDVLVGALKVVKKDLDYFAGAYDSTNIRDSARFVASSLAMVGVI